MMRKFTNTVARNTKLTKPDIKADKKISVEISFYTLSLNTTKNTKATKKIFQPTFLELLCQQIELFKKMYAEDCL